MFRALVNSSATAHNAGRLLFVQVNQSIAFEAFFFLRINKNKQLC